MTTEEDFQRALDANPEDHHTRLVFADWLQERDDPRAEGYRVLGLLRLYPIDDRVSTESGWRPIAETPWGWRDERYRPFPHACLPREWTDSGEWRFCFPTRRAAEDAAATLITKLPAEKRAELLAGVPV